MPRKLLFVFALPVLLLAACSSSKSSSTAVAPTAQPTTATTTNIIRATPVGGSGATGAPAANAPAPSSGAPGGPPGGGNRVNGTVKTVANDEVTLSDGSTFKMAANARIIKQSNGTDTDLKTGQFVAITAMRQADNTLLATIVNIFPASSTVPGGQRPLTEGNIMTNATISTISGKTFAVTFPGGGANVALAPNVQIIKQIDATASDVKVGATVGANVTDGVAQSVTVTGS